MSDRVLNATVPHTRELCVKLIDQIRRRGPLSGEELTEFAGRALDGYTRELISELLPGDATSQPLNDASIKRQFHEGLDRAGAALREVLRESNYRHAVAQVLQRKMFEAEGTLRQALRARGLGPQSAASLS